MQEYPDSGLFKTFNIRCYRSYQILSDLTAQTLSPCHHVYPKPSRLRMKRHCLAKPGPEPIPTDSNNSMHILKTSSPSQVSSGAGNMMHEIVCARCAPCRKSKCSLDLRRLDETKDWALESSSRAKPHGFNLNPGQLADGDCRMLCIVWDLSA